MQMVFQDPYSSLDPLATVADIVGEPFQVHFDMARKEREEKVVALLEQVGMSSAPPPRGSRRSSRAVSGSASRSARALALEPKLIIADEPVSALDMSTQSQVVNLLLDLQERLGVAFLFIAHDLVGRAPREPPDRGDVPRRDRRGRATPSRSTAGRATRTPRR